MNYYGKYMAPVPRKRRVVCVERLRPQGCKKEVKRSAHGEIASNARTGTPRRSRFRPTRVGGRPRPPRATETANRAPCAHHVTASTLTDLNPSKHRHINQQLAAVPLARECIRVNISHFSSKRRKTTRRVGFCFAAVCVCVWARCGRTGVWLSVGCVYIHTVRL